MKSGRYEPSCKHFPDAPTDPDLPVVDVSLSRPQDQSARGAKTWAVIDTGSGPTVLSETLRETLDLVPTDEREVVTFPLRPGEKPPRYPVCAVRVRIKGAVERVVGAVVMPLNPDVLLGRDILNDLHLMLEASSGTVLIEPGPKSAAP